MIDQEVKPKVEPTMLDLPPSVSPAPYAAREPVTQVATAGHGASRSPARLGSPSIFCQDDPFLEFLCKAEPPLTRCMPVLLEVGLSGMDDLRGLQAMPKPHRDDVFQELKRCGMTFYQVKVLEATLEITFSAVA